MVFEILGIILGIILSLIILIPLLPILGIFILIACIIGALIPVVYYIIRAILYMLGVVDSVFPRYKFPITDWEDEDEEDDEY